MKRILVSVLIVAALGGATFLVYRARSNARTSTPQAPPPSRGAGTTLPAPSTVSPDAAAPASPGAAPPVNLASVALGGRIESVSSEMSHDTWAAVHLIDHRPATAVGWKTTAHEPFPQEVVLSFLDRQPALVGAVAINPQSPESPEWWAKDVDVWTSMDSPASGFTKIGSLALRPEPIDQVITFPPVEARYVKIRVLSAQAPSSYFVALGKVKVLEGERPGYVSVVVRNPELQSARAGDGTPPAGSQTAPERDAGPPPGVPVPAGAENACVNTVPAATASRPTPAHEESRNVLVVLRVDERLYPPLTYQSEKLGAEPEYSIYTRATFTRVLPEAATPLLLLPKQGIDTVVLAQVCDIKDSVTAGFKRALLEWVGAGHKLIIQDADKCASGPDYSFLPYSFATSNPGAMGAAGKQLFLAEGNTIGNDRRDDPGFLDIESWLGNKNNNSNELGDSNTVTKYDPHWCGHVFGSNVLNVNGFIETYAHYGRGLIIYDGFDVDQRSSPVYRRLVTRELAQPFDPDGLPCGARLSDFLITTEPQLRTQFMVPGREYAFPVTLVSNQGYKGRVTLSVATIPPDPTLTYTFDAETLDLSDTARASLTVRTASTSPPTAHTLDVRGTDPSGRSNALCLQLEERRTGALRVVADIGRPQKPTRNLEIILDLSGSMKLPLGKSTRIDTARQVLRAVLAKVPDDFNVGLRFYGHRYGSRQKETCTDSELVLPIQKLDRSSILALVDRAKPRGETPLVYSILQTAADLKAAGGGSVIVVTDGEESCHGDPVTAVKELKASGLDITLNIVGFTLTGKQVQQQLSAFAEGMGGRYYSAQSGDALSRALLAAAVERIPFTVLDAAGREVAKGDSGPAAHELPPGEYKVVVRAGEQELTAEGVRITARSDTTLKVTLKGDRFELVR